MWLGYCAWSGEMSVREETSYTMWFFLAKAALVYAALKQKGLKFNHNLLQISADDAPVDLSKNAFAIPFDRKGNDVLLLYVTQK